MIKDRIKELREKNGVTISAFAKSLGISPTSASLYESGKQNPGKKTISKICETYGVDEAWLMEDAPVVTGPETKIIGDITKEADESTVATPAADEKPVAEKKRGRRPKKTKAEAAVVNTKEKEGASEVITVEKTEPEEKKEPDIPGILARANEIGVRKAAAEFGVAWQTVNKWKKDAEKAAALPKTEDKEAVMTTPADVEKSDLPTLQQIQDVMEAIADSLEEKVEEIAEDFEKAVEGKNTPEDIDKAIADVIEKDAPSEPVDEKKDIDIPTVLARVAEIGVRKAATEFGVAWQTVTKWKKDAEKAAAALPTSDDIQKTLDDLSTPEGAQEAVTTVMEMVETVVPTTKVKEEQKPDQIDISSVLARVAEIGVRKAAAEAGVAWQTVTKWKKDAEKAAAALPTSEEIQKAVDKLATPEGAQEAVTKVMEMVAPTEPAEVKETAAPAEEKKDQIDINAVLARVAEIGVRKAAAEIGVAWQTVNKWKKDAGKMATPTASTKEEKKEEKKPEEKKEDVVVAAEVIEKKTAIIIQSPLGGNITPRQVLQKIPAGSDSVYIRVDENKLYWVKGDESGAVDIW